MLKFYYLVHLQYLGYGYHGYAIQPNVRTVQKMIEKSLNFVLNEQKYKTLVTSRTDTKVSALHNVFELFVENPILDIDLFARQLDHALPSDIRILKVETTDKFFNIIQQPKQKEYSYMFSFGEKPHPFSAAIMSHFNSDLDIEIMSQGALCFEGTHDFRHYCKEQKPLMNFERTITMSKISQNTTYLANFFPSQSYIYSVHSKGFMHNQIRLMMGQLVQLGLHESTLDNLKDSLINPSWPDQKRIAPAAGLMLHSVKFED